MVRLHLSILGLRSSHVCSAPVYHESTPRPACRGTAHESIVPYQAFECKDGMYMVGAGNDKQFEKLAAAIGMPELAQDPRFKTNRNRTQNRGTLIPILQAKFK